MAIHFHDERPAQERADRNERAENRHVLERRLKRDGPDDIGHDEKLEPEEQCLGEAFLVEPVGVGAPLAQVEHKAGGSQDVAITMTATAITSMPSAEWSIA